jgi:hypothetical protein
MSPDERADTAVRDGLELVGLVHEFGQDTIAEFLRARDRPGIEALVVALAAMVPEDRTPDQLLAWLRPRRPRAKAAPKPLRACGTHAAFNRHKALGEPPCDRCVLGERQYQRDQARLQRQRARERAA